MKKAYADRKTVNHRHPQHANVKIRVEETSCFLSLFNNHVKNRKAEIICSDGSSCFAEYLPYSLPQLPPLIPVSNLPILSEGQLVHDVVTKLRSSPDGPLFADFVYCCHIMKEKDAGSRAQALPYSNERIPFAESCLCET
jgi:hypothetical protein